MNMSERGEDNYDQIKFEDQLCHPVSFQPNSVSYFSRISESIEKKIKNIESKFLQFLKIKFSYILSFIDPENFCYGSIFFFWT
jgi:hypothetical protein